MTVSESIPPANGRSLTRGLRVLEIVARAPTAVGVSEVAGLAELDKGTTSRLLAGLRELGYVRQRAADRRYVLTGKVLALARGFQTQFDLREVAHQRLSRLRDHIHETVLLTVWDDTHIVYVDQLDPDQNIRLSPRLGRNIYLHVTAMGRAILAVLPKDERATLLERLLPAELDSDIHFDPEDLTRELHLASQRGWATVDRDDDISRAGSAIVDPSGRPVGAVGVSGPAYRMAHHLDEIGRICARTARDISTELGS